MAKQNFLASMVRLHDGRRGTVVQVQGTKLTILDRGKEIIADETDVAQVGQDHKHRTYALQQKYGFRYVPNRSLAGLPAKEVQQ